MADLSGYTLGQYELIETLGKGGSATVYRAHQVSIERMVAVKVVSAEVSADEQFKARFLREAKVIARLEHDRIVPIYDFGEDHGYFYLVMRLLSTSLSRFIRRTPMSIEQTNRMVQQICQALHYAHEQNIIHRDLKPSNILLDRDNNAFLTDFGLARLAGGTSITGENILLGTPAYMAPEMWQNAEVSRQTDLYALGVMIYEMLSGKLPFEAPTPASLMYQHLQATPPRVTNIVPGVSEAAQLVVEKLLAKRPEDRYASAAEVAGDFRKATLAITKEARGVASNYDETVPKDTPAPQSEAPTAARRAVLPGSIAGKRQKIPPRPLMAQKPAEESEETMILAPTPPGFVPRRSKRLLIAGIGIAAAVILLAALAVKGGFSRAASPQTADTPTAAVSAQESAIPAVRTFSAGQNALPALAWSPDGQMVAAADDTGDIFVWQANGGQAPAQAWHAHDGGVMALAWSPDGSMLASGGADRMVRVWNPANGQLIQTLQGHIGTVDSVAWSPDGSQLASGGTDGRLYRWLAANNWEMLGPYYTAPIMTLAWSPDSSNIATSGQDHGVRVWAVGNGTNSIIGNHRALVRAMNWSPDGRSIAAISDDGEVRVWKVNGSGSTMLARQLRASAPSAQPSSTPPDGPSAVEFSPNGTRLAVADGREVHIWDTASNLLVSILTSDQTLRAIAWDATGTQIAASTSSGIVQIWTATSGTLAQLGLGNTIAAHQGQVNRLAWDQTGSRVATVGRDWAVNVWNAETGQSVAHLTGAHTTDLSAVAWSLDGAQLASGDCAGRIALWTLAQGHFEPFSTGSAACISGLAFSPDSKLLVASDTNGFLYAWNLNTGDLMIHRGVQPSAINALAWAHDASTFATAGQDGTLRLWQISGNQLIPRAMRQLNGTALTALGWDSSDLPALAGGADGTIELWYSPLDSDSADEFGQHPAQVTAVSRSSDGRWTASTDTNGCLILWRTATAERLIELCPPASDSYHTLQWSPNGNMLAAGTDDGKLTLWRVG